MDKILAAFIQGIICQVHVCVLHISASRGFIWRRRKAGHALFAYVKPQRLQRGDQHINAEVKFEAIEQERIPHVLLHDSI